MPALFNASMMCMDLFHIAEQLDILNDACDMLHADVMDGHFCKNITLGFDFIKAICAHAKKPVEAHMMVTAPNDFIDRLLAAGVGIISLHAETINADAFRTLHKIKAAGCKFGVVLNPATPLDAVRAYLGHVDMLTIMTVDCGYAAQPFIPEMLEKIEAARALGEEKGYHYIIQSDGANNLATYGPLYRAGVRSFVMGSTGLFGRNKSLEKATAIMKSEFAQAINA